LQQLEIRDLVVHYKVPIGTIKTLFDLQLDIEKGDSIGIVGESGSGKSTLGLSIVGLLPPNARVKGHIVFEGKDLLKMQPGKMNGIRGTGIFMIMQDPFNSLNPVKKIKDQLIEALQVRYSRNGEKAQKGKLYDEVLKRLRDVKLPDPEAIMDRYPHQLSGGQIQRVVIAMGLLLEPDILIADEPTSALDVSVQAQIIALIKELQDRYRMSLLFITHDLSIAYAVSEKLLILYGGRILEFGKTEDVINNPAHPYTEGLLKSFPRGNYKDGKLYTLSGMPPLFTSMPDGCVFNPRCPYAFDRCYKEEPELYNYMDKKVRCFLKHD
jgi:peptide/nickel transport system ATP-binding protein